MGVRAFFFQKLKFFIRSRARCVYTDDFGNAYYSQVVRGKERRWVVYSGKADPSAVPAKCHLWLHYTSDEILPGPSRSTHVPNMTGTENAYHPHRVLPPNV